MSEVEPTAPPGWYADGQLSGHLRYWDGHGWTDYFRPDFSDAGAVGPRHYLNGAPSGFAEGVTSAVRYAFTYRGRASRSSYAWALLGATLFIVTVVASFSFFFTWALALEPPLDEIAWWSLFVIWCLLLLAAAVIVFAATWRRLQDAGVPGAIAFVALVAGPIVFLVFAFVPPETRANRYTLLSP